MGGKVGEEVGMQGPAGEGDHTIRDEGRSGAARILWFHLGMPAFTSMEYGVVNSLETTFRAYYQSFSTH